MFSKVNSMSKYAPTMVPDSRAIMSKFISGVSKIVVKKCRTTILIGDMDISRLFYMHNKLKMIKLRKNLEW